MASWTCDGVVLGSNPAGSDGVEFVLLRFPLGVGVVLAHTFYRASMQFIHFNVWACSPFHSHVTLLLLLAHQCAFNYVGA